MEEKMNKIKKIATVENLSKIFLIYILLQPFFDILSFLDIRGMIPFGISTYVKPLIVFGLGAFIFFTNKEQRKKWFLLYFIYVVLMIIHSLMLKELNTANSVVFQEIRYMINIAYMLALYMIFDFFYRNYENREEFIQKLKKTIVWTFLFYCITILLAIVTGTSGKTYEYADPNKQGFKGWLDSGQIFGHALSIWIPFILYYLLNFKHEKKAVEVLVKIMAILPVVILSLIGTKVTFYMVVIVAITHAVIDGFYGIRQKNKTHLGNAVICLVIVVGLVAFYKHSPVYVNVEINRAVLNEGVSEDTIKREQNSRKDLRQLEKDISGLNGTKNKREQRKLKTLKDYYEWDSKATSILEKKYIDGSVHPSDNRAKQLVYNWQKFKLASPKYKLFGLGYLNQPGELQIERDLFMVIFSLGILGTLTILVYPISKFVKAGICILQNLKTVSPETLYLFEGFGIFFCISIYAGYTFIYTNFSIFLVALITVLRWNMDCMQVEKREKAGFLKGMKKCFNGTNEAFYTKVEENLDKEQKMFIVTANPETFMRAHQDKEIEKMLMDDQTTIIPDGVGVIKGAQYAGIKMQENVTGVDLAKKLLEYANEKKKSIYLFGASREVSEQMEEMLKRDYPNAILAGRQDGYVEDKKKAMQEAAKTKPDVVLVALGAPIQEMLIYENLEAFEKGILVGVGGSFDVLSGSKKRAPKFFVKLKLEWLYRITTEPKRLKRFVRYNIPYGFKMLQYKEL